jgi:hypothetical protein
MEATDAMMTIIRDAAIGEKECDGCEKTPKASGVMWEGGFMPVGGVLAPRGD